MRIVLADDHPPLIDACRRLLRPHHEVVATVTNGRDALAAVEEHAPDVLVLDVSMPDMTGIEVLEELHVRGSTARIVVLTLYSDRAIAAQALALGASAFVTKSRMARDLPDAIRAAMSGDPFCSPLDA